MLLANSAYLTAGLDHSVVEITSVAAVETATALRIQVGIVLAAGKETDHWLLLELFSPKILDPVEKVCVKLEVGISSSLG